MKATIKPEHYQRLVKLEQKMQSIDSFAKQVMQQGQQMIQEARNEVQEVWMDIAQSNPDIDFKNTDWAPTTEKNTIVATMTRHKLDGN